MKKLLIIILFCIVSLNNVSAEEEIIWQKGVSHLGVCSKAIISPTGNHIANTLNKLIQIRNDVGSTLTTLDGHDEFVTDIAFSADGEYLFSGDGNWDNVEYASSIIMWNLTDYNIENAYSTDNPDNYFYVESISISDDGTMLAGLLTARTKTVGKHDRTIFIWNIETTEILAKFNFIGSQYISKLKFSNDKLFFNLGERIAMIQTNNFVLVDKLGENEPWHNIPINDFDISGDKNFLCTVDLDGNSKILDLSNYTIISEFIPISNSPKLTHVRYGKNDEYLIFINNRINNLTIYNIGAKEPYHIFKNHKSVLTTFDVNLNKDKALLNDEDNLYYINLIYEKTIDIDELEKTLQISVYPNPVDEKLYIVNPDGRSYHYKIVNCIGKEILSGQINNTYYPIEFSEIPHGYYQIIIYNDNNFFTRKLIK